MKYLLGAAALIALGIAIQMLGPAGYTIAMVILVVSVALECVGGPHG